MLGKRLRVRVLQVRRETLDELVQALGETLGTGVKGLECEAGRGGKTDVTFEAKTVRQTRIVGSEDRLADAGCDDDGRELLLPRNRKFQGARRAAQRRDRYLDLGHLGPGAQGARDGGEAVLRDGS